MNGEEYVIGIDFGTDSVRSIIVDAGNGGEISSAVHYYDRWKSGLYCDPVNNRFRQHPLDYVEGLEVTVKKAIGGRSDIAKNVKGISVDTTGSTPAAVDETGTPLSLRDRFRDNPNAMFVLWKDHTAVREAEEINAAAKKWRGVDYTKYVGGVYSSEWFWAKILHVLREDRDVRAAAYSWVEHCDWIPALLTGNADPLRLIRSRCAAGHKAMWHEEFDGLPDEKFLVSIDPALAGLRGRLYRDTFTNEKSAGTLTQEWADRLGLGRNVTVGVGAFDAHMGAVGGEIEPYALCKIVGTSTCDILVAPLEDIGNKLIKGICGQVDGSVLPGMLGMEAGQSAFGDIYAWFKNLLLWPVANLLQRSGLPEKAAAELEKRIIPELNAAAEKIPPGETDLVSLDWMNGRRTPFANQSLKGAITGINLGSDAPRIYRSLVEATAFGAKKINERFGEEGVDIRRVIALGGVTKKSPFIMQVLADVLDMPIKVARAEQACALGAAMCAAAAAGIHPSLRDAQKAMGNGFEREYVPDPRKAAVYRKLYEKYSATAELIEKGLYAPGRA